MLFRSPATDHLQVPAPRFLVWGEGIRTLGDPDRKGAKVKVEKEQLLNITKVFEITAGSGFF